MAWRGAGAPARAGWHGWARRPGGGPRPAPGGGPRRFGGLPVAVPPDERARLLSKLVDAGWYPATTHWPFPVSNPYGIEGYKTIAFEIAEQLGAERAAAAHVFVPVGGGDSLYGIY